MLAAPSVAYLRQVAEDLADRADHDHQRDRDEEEVGRERERLAGLPDAAQVAVGEYQDEADRISTLYGPSDGTVEVIAATPAAACTATVTM